MRAWFLVGALVLGIIGMWGEQGRSNQGGHPLNRGSEGTVSAQDGGSTIPTPRPPSLDMGR